MSAILKFTPWLWLLVSGVAQGACETRVEPVAARATGGSELRAIVLDPPAGAELRADSVLTIDFQYHIARFETGTFKVLPLFKTGARGSTGVEIDGKDFELPLETAAGRARLCLPMSSLYDQYAAKVVWPLEMSLVILKADKAGYGVSVAQGEPLKLNALNVPQAALDRQAKSPPAEIEIAIESAFDNYSNRIAVYKVCLRRLPALQPRLTPAYRAWEARHKADIDWISGLKYEALKRQYDGNGESAMSVIDHHTEFMQKSYESWTNDQLQPQCEDVIAQGDPGEVDKPLARDLARLRQWEARP